ncbi:unnamed protein product, partial [Medioppia subpectinata]
MFIRGLKRDVQMSDLYKCPDSDVCEKLVHKLENNWNRELTKKSPSFMRATVKTFIGPLVPSFILIFIGECVIDNGKTILLGYVLRFFANPETESLWRASVFAGALVASSLIFISFLHPAFFLAYRVAVKIRVCWCALMYKKTTIGQILNLMSNDVSRLDDVCVVTDNNI